MATSTRTPSTEPRRDVRVVIRICPEVFEYFALKGKRLDNRRQPHQQIAWEVEQLVRQLSFSRALDANPQKTG